MQWFWQHTTPRRQAHSRPRVALAGARAAAASPAVAEGLGSATAGVGGFIVAVPAAGGPRHGGLAGVMPGALFDTAARAARATGRAPEEVWAEALGTWLAWHGDARDTEASGGPVAPPARAGGAPAAALPTPPARRRQSWHEIDETLRVLRAG